MLLNMYTLSTCLYLIFKILFLEQLLFISVLIHLQLIYQVFVKIDK